MVHKAKCCSYRFLTTILTLLGVMILEPSVHADYLVKSVGDLGGGTIRYKRNGAFVNSSSPIEHDEDDEFNDYQYMGVRTHVLSDDLQTVYQIGSDLGLFVFPFETTSGEPVGTVNRLQISHSLAVFEFDTIVRNNWIFLQENQSLQAFSLESGARVDGVSSLVPGLIKEVDYGPSSINLAGLGYIYSSTSTGIYRNLFLDSAGFFGGTETVLEGKSGDIAIGPDGLLYVREDASGDVNKYDPSSGEFVETFLNAASFDGDLGSIQFGVDGDFYAYLYRDAGFSEEEAHVIHIDGQTGTTLRTTNIGLRFGGLGIQGRIYVLPVPEPASAYYLSIALLLATTSVRRFHAPNRSSLRPAPKSISS